MPPPPNGRKTALGLGFSRFIDYFHKRKAFTLAEVLITLTIIGVIAAITIPNLMQSYKKHQVEVGVKEAYTILSNAIKMSEKENGEFTETNISIEDYILPYLKVVRTCGNMVYDTKNVCFDKTWKTSSGKTMSPYPGVASYTQYLLANGMSLVMIRDYPGYWGRQPRGSQITFLIDLNGKKGPNQFGSDMFHYSLKYIYHWPNRTDRQFFQAGMIPYNDFNKEKLAQNSLEHYMSSSTQGGCSADGSANGVLSPGALCAAVIQKNGWKIPDDYPIKKF